MEIRFKRFNPLTDTIKPFDCTDADLNGFLLESNDDVPNATQHAKQLLAVTYLIEDIESGKTVAYFSLLHDRIERDFADKTTWSRQTMVLYRQQGWMPIHYRRCSPLGS